MKLAVRYVELWEEMVTKAQFEEIKRLLEEIKRLFVETLEVISD